MPDCVEVLLGSDISIAVAGIDWFGSGVTGVHVPEEFGELGACGIPVRGTLGL